MQFFQKSTKKIRWNWLIVAGENPKLKTGKNSVIFKNFTYPILSKKKILDYWVKRLLSVRIVIIIQF